MLSQTKNRVQAIRSKFENLNNENKTVSQLNKHDKNNVNDKENEEINIFNKEVDNFSDSSDEWPPKPNNSYLYNKSDAKHSVSDSKKSLVRQSSDPCKKLHRSHAFRCDRSQKVVSPKRHGSCNGRSETNDFSLKMEKKLSKDKLKRLGNLLEDQMKKENFVLKNNNTIVGEPKEIKNSIPDSEVPQHILDQYAKVVKRNNEKQDAMTDSGVSSETENLEDEKSGRIKKLLSQFEKPDKEIETDSRNLEVMNDLSISSETMRLERKNPHLVLTDTLKKALKQPLPPGPPPRKPPRIFIPMKLESLEKKKDPKEMLEKLEQVLQKRESQNQKHEFNSVETANTKEKPKEIHYLCTEILDITHRTLLLNQTSNCFKSLNCATTNNSTLSLPYTQLNTRNGPCCTCSNDNMNRASGTLSTFLNQTKCTKCRSNDQKDDRFKCFLNCKCKSANCQFFVDEHIYDEPCNEFQSVTIGRRSGWSNRYGTLNFSKSLEDLRVKNFEESKIYDIPCDVSRPETPQAASSSTPSPKSSPKDEKKCSPKTDFEKLLHNFEKGVVVDSKRNSNYSIDKKETKIGNGTDVNSKSDVNELVNKTDEEKFGVKTKNLNSIKHQISNFEESTRFYTEKPPMKPKPAFIKNKFSKSSENLKDDIKIDKTIGGVGAKTNDGRFDTKKNKKFERKDTGGVTFSVPKKDNSQLDVDKENLNRLMTEIYETVTAGCSMENKPGSFPIQDQPDNASEESVKLTRSLTEKRKNYVRRVSSRVAYLDQKSMKNTRYRHQTSICSYKSEPSETIYNTFRSWKSFRTSQNNLNNKMADLTDSKCNLTDSKGNILTMKDELGSTESLDTSSIDEKTGCVDIELPFEPRERSLFNVCLLVGMNHMTGEAYVKSVFPAQVHVPPHIENLIFPETFSSTDNGEWRREKGEWSVEASGTQCYSLILTDERGERSYGYCRRVLPEGATTCLPLCYCLIGKYRAPGFYYKILQEIESHHGSSDVEIHSILQQLFETDFPSAGEEITITYTKNNGQTRIFRNSINLGDVLKCKTMPDIRHCRNSISPAKSAEISGSSTENSGRSAGISNGDDVFEDKSETLPDFYDLENNNSPKKVKLYFDGPRTKIIKRPIEPRVDEDCLSILVDSLGAGLTIKVFGSLLLERKVIIMGDQLSLISSCLEGLQAALYPFVWQQPLIACVPSQVRKAALEAPLPMLAGTLPAPPIPPHEGMLIDLRQSSKLLYYQGDESTILPTTSYKTLKTALQMDIKQKEDRKMRNMLISEAFLRFFVDILGDFWRFFKDGELEERGFGRGDVVFDKESFLKSATSKQNQNFFEWFVDTAMFYHFIQNMSTFYHNRQTPLHETKASDKKETTPSSDKNRKLNDTTSIEKLLSTSDTSSFSTFKRTPCTERNRHTDATATPTDINNVSRHNIDVMDLIDTPLPDFYDLFHERVKSKYYKNDSDKSMDKSNNVKTAMNKRVRHLKNKLRELIA